jgi:hypothetical protein
VFFVRVTGEQRLDSTPVIYPTNYSNGTSFYLVNAPPGRYVAIGLRGSAGIMNVGDRKMLFGRKFMELTEVEVTAGSVAFMGAYAVDLSRYAGNQDDLPLTYYRAIVADTTDDPLIPRIFAGAPHSAQRDAQAERRFLEATLKAFGDSPWSQAIRQRLDALEKLHTP